MTQVMEMLMKTPTGTEVPSLLGFSLRQAEASDCRLFWEWANDVETRAASFHSQPILWEDHVSWFMGKLHDSQCLLLVASDEQAGPRGQVRFDRQEESATVSVSLGTSFRGRGLAVPLIRAASQECFRRTPAGTIYAFVKADNSRSLRAFAGAGYGARTAAEVHHQAAVRLALHRGTTE